MSSNFETTAIRTQMDRSTFSEHSSPLYLTSSFVFEDAEGIEVPIIPGLKTAFHAQTT